MVAQGDTLVPEWDEETSAHKGCQAWVLRPEKSEADTAAPGSTVGAECTQ